MKFLNTLLLVTALACEHTIAKVVTNQNFRYNFFCEENDSSCDTINNGLYNAVTSISSLLSLASPVEFDAVVDDITKYKKDATKDTLAAVFDANFISTTNYNSYKKRDTEYDKAFVMVLNNLNEADGMTEVDYENWAIIEIMKKLEALKRLDFPYKKFTENVPGANFNLLVKNETVLYEKCAINDQNCKNNDLNDLNTIIHWRNTLISKGDPAETADYPYRRVVAVGDIHGDYAKLVKILRHAKLINNKNEWIGYDTMLVQTGDLIDRGSDILKILELVQDIREQAKVKGGVVHLLYGNHEIFNFQRNYQYTSTSDFIASGGIQNREEAFSLNGKFGNLLRKELNITMVLNDSLFVHAGLLPQYAELGIDYMNNRAHEILTSAPSLDELYEMKLRNEIHPIFNDPLFDAGKYDGPLMTRMYTYLPEAQACQQLERTLELTNAKRMIVGHTIQEYGQIHTRCDNKFILIDLGMSHCYGDYFGYLEILNDKNEVWAIYDN